MNEDKVIAYYSMGLCGYEIFEIEYGIDEHVIYRFQSGTDKVYKKQRRKINYSNGRAYFKDGAITVYLDECIRTNI
jgi:hypothetical protein